MRLVLTNPLLFLQVLPQSNYQESLTFAMYRCLDKLRSTYGIPLCCSPCFHSSMRATLDFHLPPSPSSHSILETVTIHPTRAIVLSLVLDHTSLLRAPAPAFLSFCTWPREDSRLVVAVRFGSMGWV